MAWWKVGLLFLFIAVINGIPQDPPITNALPTTTTAPTPTTTTAPTPTTTNAPTPTTTNAPTPTITPPTTDPNDKKSAYFKLSEDSHENYACSTELEKIITDAIQAEISGNKAEVDNLITQAEAKKAEIEKTSNSTIYYCNRRRLMTCDTDQKCKCAGISTTIDGLFTERRLLPKYGVKSFYCYLANGKCDHNVGQIIDTFEEQKQQMLKHYGDASNGMHKDAVGCLRNLCVDVDTTKFACLGNGHIKRGRHLPTSRRLGTGIFGRKMI